MNSNAITISSKSMQLIDDINIYHYNDIKYDENVKIIKRIKKKSGYTDNLLKIELQIMVSRHILILFARHSYTDEGNIIIFNNTSATNYVPSGLLLSYMWVDKTAAGVSWVQDHYNIVESSKNSVITATKKHKNLISIRGWIT